MTVDSDPLARVPSKGLAVLAYCVSLLAAMLIYATLHQTGSWLSTTIALPVLALIWCASVVIRLRRARVCVPSAANRAYMRRFIPMMLAYVLVLFGVVWINQRYAPSGPTAVILAVLPALPMVGVVWALGRLLVEESDEYLRSLTVRQFMIATGFMLCVTSIWGFLDAFGQVPHVPMYWAFIIWCVGLGVGSFVNELRS